MISGETLERCSRGWRAGTGRRDARRIAVSEINDDAAGFFRIVYSTRALRRLKPDPVPEEMLFQLIDAAIRAPSGQNAQDWRFVVVTDAAIKGLMQEAASAAWARYQSKFAADPSLMDALPRTKRLSLKSTAHLAAHVGEAPAVIVACGMKGRHSSPGGSIFPAVQNLLLAARALGLGASIFQLALSPAVVEAIGVPEEYQPYCVVPVGYPADAPGPVRRKPVRDVAFRDRWGERWALAESQPDEGWRTRWDATDDNSV
jgi:nitroreductase